MTKELSYEMLELYNVRRELSHMRKKSNGITKCEKKTITLLRARIWKEVMARIERLERRDIGHFKGTTSRQSQNKKRRVTE